jgi:hypothetical protein
MRTVLSGLLGGLILLSTTGNGFSEEKEAARELIQKAITAAGGEAALAKHQAMTWKEVGTYHGMGNPLPYTGLYAAQFPDYFRMEIEGVFTSVYAKDKGWTRMGDTVKEMTKEELAAQQSDHRAGWIASVLPLKDKAFTLVSLGEVKVGDQPALGVKVTREGYPEVKLYFDQKSHLLLRSVYPTKAAEEGFKDTTMEVSFSNFKKIDGATVPTKIVINRGGKVFVETEIQDLKAVGKLDPKVFGKP